MAVLRLSLIAIFSIFVAAVACSILMTLGVAFDTLGKSRQFVTFLGDITPAIFLATMVSVPPLALVIGAPVVFLLRRTGLNSVLAFVALGFLLGCLPFAIWGQAPRATVATLLARDNLLVLLLAGCAGGIGGWSFWRLSPVPAPEVGDITKQ